MNRLLGLDEALLRQTGAVEQAGYRMVTYLFLLVTAFSIFSNGYFGFLLLRNWWGVLLLGLLMGYIHFSVLRIALITLMTKPLVDKQLASVTTAPGAIKRTLKSLRKLNLSSLVRFVFVGLIAISICVPLATLLFHQQAMQVEEAYRLELAAAVGSSSLVDASALNEAHFPFVIFEQLWKFSGFKYVLLVLFVAVYAPLLALARLRYGNNNRYAELCRESMRKEVLIDYQETIEQSQYYLDKHHPWFDKKLMDLTPFSDAPFKQVLNRGSSRSFGTSDEFRNFMRTR